MRIRFGPFAFDRQNRLLWRDGAEVSLPPRVLGVLEVLIDRPGQVVARQDLLDGVWKDAFVTDTSLAEAVSSLRQALGDDPQAPRYIQTVHRRGYRFLAPISQPVVTHPDVDGRASRGWLLVPLSAALITLGFLIGAMWQVTPAPPADAAPIARFDLRPAPGTSFDRRAAPALAVSPNGSTIAWSACAAETRTCALYVRTMDRLEPLKLPGTDGAAAPFFSADGRWLGFFADGKLKKVAVAGGAPSILAEAAVPGGATWAADGRIAFSGSPAGGISIVSDQAGAVTPLTSPRIERGEVRHLHPAWLPSGALLFTIATDPLGATDGELVVLPRGSRQWKTLRNGVTRAAPFGAGYLLLSAGRDMQAATFDERTLTLTGGADSVLASIAGGEELSTFAVGGGTLAAASTPASTLAWSDGVPAPNLARLSSVAIAPDSKRAAGVIADGGGSDIWIADLTSGGTTRITYGGLNVSPAWAPDGSQVFYATRTTGPFGLARRNVDASAPAQPIASGSAHIFPSSIASDGRIAATIVVAGGRTTVGIVPAAGGSPRILESGPYNERAAAFSPDGKWLALESDESGRTEIVVRAADADAGSRRIALSREGGTRPQWSADGRFIYFESGGRTARASFNATATDAAVDIVFDRHDTQPVAITAGGRTLFARPAAQGERAVVVLQWVRELRQRLPAPTGAPR
jgi:DNA-binding winged helix-turn-helix (wHTH) protein